MPNFWLVLNSRKLVTCFRRLWKVESILVHILRTTYPFCSSKYSLECFFNRLNRCRIGFYLPVNVRECLEIVQLPRKLVSDWYGKCHKFRGYWFCLRLFIFFIPWVNGLRERLLFRRQSSAIGTKIPISVWDPKMH